MVKPYRHSGVMKENKAPKDSDNAAMTARIKYSRTKSSFYLQKLLYNQRRLIT